MVESPFVQSNNARFTLESGAACIEPSVTEALMGRVTCVVNRAS